jgi:predicted HNH restriction endonuclease
MSNIENNEGQDRADQLPSVEQLCDLILHTLQTFGGSGFKDRIYTNIVELGQIPKYLTPSKQRKIKTWFKRAVIDLEKHGLVENSSGFLTAKWKEAVEPKPADDFDAINDIETDTPDRVTRYNTVYARNPAIRAAVMKRAKGKCEFCGAFGFTSVDGTPYLECHHIVALANDGADRMTNVIALCANHHREAHFGEQREEIEKQMIQTVLLLEGKATNALPPLNSI